MIIDLKKLNTEKVIPISFDVLYDPSIDERIHGLDKAKVVGEIFKNSEEEIFLQVTFTGDMLISDAISLENVPYHFEIKIDENLEDIANNYLNVYEKMQNTLDLKQVLWQNIVLEVPISYSICKDSSLKGEGWEFRSDEKKSAGIDPRLKKLEDLLKGDD